MKMNNKSLCFALLGIFFLVFSVSAASAAVLELTDIVLTSSTANPGSDVLVTFKLNHTGESVNSQVGLDWSQSSLNKGTFRQLPTIDSINVNETRQLAAIISVPSNSSGTLTFTIKVESDSSATAEFTRSLTINEVPSLLVTKTKEITTTQNGTIKVENKGNSVLTNIVMSKTSGTLEVEFSENNFDLSPGASKTLDVKALSLTNLGFGGKSAVVKAEATSGGPASSSVTFDVKGSFCSAGEKGGNLSISDFSIDYSGEGDENEWNLKDKIEIEVEVENNGDDDVDDVFVELGLFDSTGKNVIGDFDFDNADEEEFDIGRIRDDDSETVTFIFTIPADMDDGSYKLVVKAYSDDVGQSNECTDTSSDLSDDTFEAIEINREDDEGKFISFDDIVLSPSEATCGDMVTLSATAFNIGDEDQDQVRIELSNRELGISENFEIRNDMDMGDDEDFSFEFMIPESATDKTYTLELTASYDYDNGDYDQSLDDSVNVPLKVLGCSGNGNNGGNTGNIASIRADLDSEVKAGSELVVKATITNLRNQATSFVIDAADYEDWATLSGISPRILNLAAGESKEVTVRLNLAEDAEGTNTFSIEAVSGSDTETQDVEVSIPASGSSSGFNLGNNTYLWIIGAVNVILIVLIIVVAVRISRR